MDATTRVLVVDDAYAEGPLFQLAFGEQVKSCASTAALTARIAEGATWDVAFVDFHLGGPTTGLSALHLLAAPGVCGRRVTYTTTAESGRLMYLAAAKQWFGSAACFDKTHSRPDALRRVVSELGAGFDPTPPVLRANLRSSHLIDAVLPDHTALRLWRAWHQLDGDAPAVEGSADVSRYTNRAFSERGVEAAVAFDAAFASKPPPDPHGYRNKKGIITRFVAENYQFFNAPDLDQALTWRSQR